MDDISKKGSFKGYRFSIWLDKNKNTLKALLSAGVGVGLFFLPQIPEPSVSAGVGVAGAAVTKLIVDTFDFWVSNVEIPRDPPPI